MSLRSVIVLNTCLVLSFVEIKCAAPKIAKTIELVPVKRSNPDDEISYVDVGDDYDVLEDDDSSDDPDYVDDTTEVDDEDDITYEYKPVKVVRLKDQTKQDEKPISDQGECESDDDIDDDNSESNFVPGEVKPLRKESTAKKPKLRASKPGAQITPSSIRSSSSSKVTKKDSMTSQVKEKTDTAVVAADCAPVVPTPAIESVTKLEGVGTNTKPNDNEHAATINDKADNVDDDTSNSDGELETTKPTQETIKQMKKDVSSKKSTPSIRRGENSSGGLKTTKPETQRSSSTHTARRKQIKEHGTMTSPMEDKNDETGFATESVSGIITPVTISKPKNKNGRKTSVGNDSHSAAENNNQAAIPSKDVVDDDGNVSEYKPDAPKSRKKRSDTESDVLSHSEQRKQRKQRKPEALVKAEEAIHRSPSKSPRKGSQATRRSLTASQNTKELETAVVGAGSGPVVPIKSVTESVPKSEGVETNSVRDDSHSVAETDDQGEIGSDDGVDDDNSASEYQPKAPKPRNKRSETGSDALSHSERRKQRKQGKPEAVVKAEEAIHRSPSKSPRKESQATRRSSTASQVTKELETAVVGADSDPVVPIKPVTESVPKSEGVETKSVRHDSHSVAETDDQGEIGSDDGVDDDNSASEYQPKAPKPRNKRSETGSDALSHSERRKQRKQGKPEAVVKAEEAIHRSPSKSPRKESQATRRSSTASQVTKELETAVVGADSDPVVPIKPVTESVPKSEGVETKSVRDDSHSVAETDDQGEIGSDDGVDDDNSASEYQPKAPKPRNKRSETESDALSLSEQRKQRKQRKPEVLLKAEKAIHRSPSKSPRKGSQATRRSSTASQVTKELETAVVGAGSGPVVPIKPVTESVPKSEGVEMKSVRDDSHSAAETDDQGEIGSDDGVDDDNSASECKPDAPIPRKKRSDTESDALSHSEGRKPRKQGKPEAVVKAEGTIHRSPSKSPRKGSLSTRRSSTASQVNKKLETAVVGDDSDPVVPIEPVTESVQERKGVRANSVRMGNRYGADSDEYLGDVDDDDNDSDFEPVNEPSRKGRDPKKIKLPVRKQRTHSRGTELKKSEEETVLSSSISTNRGRKLTKNDKTLLSSLQSIESVSSNSVTALQGSGSVNPGKADRSGSFHEKDHSEDSGSDSESDISGPGIKKNKSSLKKEELKGNGGSDHDNGVGSYTKEKSDGEDTDSEKVDDFPGSDSTSDVESDLDISVLSIDYIEDLEKNKIPGICSLKLNYDLAKKYETLFLVKDVQQRFRLALPHLIAKGADDNYTKGIAALEFSKDKSMFMACPGKNNRIKEGLSDFGALREIKCISGSTVTLHSDQGEESISVDTKQLSCSKAAAGSAIFSKDRTPCGTPGKEEGVLIELGFLVKGWHKLIDVCYDADNLRTLYATHILFGNVMAGAVVDSNRPKFRKGIDEFYEVNPLLYYNQDSQEALFIEILGAEDYATYFDIKKNFYLAKGHYAPDADFPLKTWQDLTYFTENIGPLWQSINQGGWFHSVEARVRKLGKKLMEILNISTGPYGIMKIKNKNGVEEDLYLKPMKMKKKKEFKLLAVPAYYWKIVHRPKTNECVVLISSNNPFIQKLEQFCQNICEDYGWKTNSDNPHKGLVTCCTYDDFKSTVTYAPAYDCSGGILRGP